MIAPFPAFDKVCGLVVEDGDTRNITLLATLAPLREPEIIHQDYVSLQ